MTGAHFGGHLEVVGSDMTPRRFLGAAQWGRLLVVDRIL